MSRVRADVSAVDPSGSPRVFVLAYWAPDLYPQLYHLAAGLADAGARVSFLSVDAPTKHGAGEHPGVAWAPRPPSRGRSPLPWFRANYHLIFRMLVRAKPAVVVAQRDYLIVALLYRLLLPWRRARIAAYSTDYDDRARYLMLQKPFAGLLDVWIDICDLRVQWRQHDWPRMTAIPFVVRQAPHRVQRVGPVPAPPEASALPSPRVVLTSSKYLLLRDRARLSRFLAALCERGIELDWYLALDDDDDAAAARSLCADPRFTVRPAVEKAALLPLLGGYDAGLFYAPLAEYDPRDPAGRSHFLSAASNKIGEYIAAGLIVAHSSNPGLAYLPAAVGLAFDPSDPDAGAEQVACVLHDRAEVARRRSAVSRYHEDEMNLEAQAAPLIRHLLEAR